MITATENRRQEIRKFEFQTILSYMRPVSKKKEREREVGRKVLRKYGYYSHI